MDIGCNIEEVVHAEARWGGGGGGGAGANLEREAADKRVLSTATPES